MASAAAPECDSGISDTEVAGDGSDDEVWSKWSSMMANQHRTRWITDGFSTLPFLRR